MPNPRVSLEQWRVLHAVVDCGGFAQAAQHLHRSQSSVSYTIAQIQERLGIHLFRLEGRKSRLTEAGRALLQRSRLVVREAQALEEFAHGLDAGWEPEVRLVVDAAFPNHLLMEALNRFEPRAGGTQVQLREVVLSGAEEALEDKATDLVIGGFVPSPFLGDPLVEIEFAAVANADHRLHQLDRPLTSADLERERQVVILDSGIQRQQDVGWLEAKQRWRVSNMETAVAVVRAGLGFAWLPRHRIAELIESGSLVPLPLQAGAVYRATLYLIHAARTAPRPGALLLARLLKEVAGAEAATRHQSSPQD